MLELLRDTFTDESTIGELYGDGDFLCDTLEDTVRDEGIKIYGKTAIPMGTYEIIIKDSPHFQRPMPYLVDVPNFTDIMLHWGTKSADTLGCILLGSRDAKVKNFVGHSRDAFNEIVLPWITERFQKKEKLFMVIRNAGIVDEERAAHTGVI